MKIFERRTNTPTGILQILANEHAIVSVRWPSQVAKAEHPPMWSAELNNFSPTSPGQHALLDQCEEEIELYFQRKLTAFQTPVEAIGTEFQKLVWRALLQIPYGETRTYGEIAQLLNKPKGAQAVGSAIGKNPVGILIPCHRVIGKNGDLIGFAGGVATKASLLKMEKPLVEAFI
jgi:methylated-DNA-[protein]-cysteine S-methyltransferase